MDLPQAEGIGSGLPVQFCASLRSCVFAVRAGWALSSVGSTAPPTLAGPCGRLMSCYKSLEQYVNFEECAACLSPVEPSQASTLMVLLLTFTIVGWVGLTSTACCPIYSKIQMAHLNVSLPQMLTVQSVWC
jgi:hypothetical protein